MNSEVALNPHWMRALIAALLGLVGCAEPLQPLDPRAPTGRPMAPSRALPTEIRSAAVAAAARFPLRVGNRWSYSFESTHTPVSCIPEVGPQPAYRVLGTLRDEITCELQVDGSQVFVLKRRSAVTSAPWGGGQTDMWAYYREDRSGLYFGTFDGPHGDPCGNPEILVRPPSPPSDFLVHLVQRGQRSPRLAVFPEALLEASSFYETKYLGYPLHVGARWPWDPSGLVGQQVEAVEVIDLPVGRVPAYRIRAFGLPPGWQFTWWYGRSGLLKMTERRLQKCEFPVCGCDDLIESSLILTDVDVDRSPKASVR